MALLPQELNLCRYFVHFAPNPFILALYSSTCPTCLTQSQSATLESPTPSASSAAPAPTRLWRRTLWPQRLDALGAAGGEVGIDVEVRAVEVLVVVGDGESGADSQPTRTDGGVAPKNVQSPTPCMGKLNSIQCLPSTSNP